MKSLILIKCFVFFLFSFLSCVSGSARIITGAERTEDYMDILYGKRVAVTGNHTSLVNSAHLVDTLLSRGIDVVKIFSPEHGFRGIAGAGEKVVDTIDQKTGIPVISLYGSRRKPDDVDMDGFEIMVFDLQDVGVRFYTYISTLHYIMEACALKGIPLLLLDRPNPNGNYVDGPVLEMEFQSFVGMHPVPLVHGMTLAEYARMINGEGWLKEGVECALHIIPCMNYSHDMEYVLPVPPSPNLRSQHAIRLYPSIALFEGTVISEGRGTDHPFEIFGHPELASGDFYFTPESRSGAMHPKYTGQLCRGTDLRNWEPPVGQWENIELKWLIEAYCQYPYKDKFFNNYFYRLTGTRQVADDITAGESELEIRDKWKNDLTEFISVREKYLLYP